MNQDSSFWCIKLPPGTTYKIDLPESTELKLTNACIVPQTPPLPSNGVSFVSNTPPQLPLSFTRLYVQPNSSNGESSDSILLGTFIPNRIEHQNIQYTIQSDHRRCSYLQNVNSGGPGDILHICGTISLIDQKIEYEEDEEDEEKSNQNQSNHASHNNFHYGANDDEDEGFNFGGQSLFSAFGL